MNASTILTHAVKTITVLAIAGALMVPATNVHAERVSIENGAWMEILGTTDATDGAGVLVLMRVTLDPGAAIRTHRHPEPALFVVESGTLDTTIIRGGGTIYRGSENESERIGRYASMTLAAGDWIAYDEGAEMTMVNRSNDALVLTASVFSSDGASLFDFEPAPRQFNPHLQ